jgi:hypothetical protein
LREERNPGEKGESMRFLLSIGQMQRGERQPVHMHSGLSAYLSTLQFEKDEQKVLP